MRIAIVGAGVSGLVVAYLLHRDHEVTVFESGDYAGGHTNTIRVDTADETLYVDSGFIVFNDRNYPRFERLLARLGVVSQPSVMSFSVSDGTGDFEYSSGSPNGLFAKRAHLVTPWFHRMVADLARFNRAGPAAARAPRQRHLAGGLARAPRVLAPVRGATDRSAGVGGVVGRPEPAVDLPGSVPGRVLRQPRSAVMAGPTALAGDPRRLGSLRRGAHPAVRRSSAPAARPCSR